MLQIKDTNVLKGVAIMLMLIHHLFWKQNGLYNDIHLFGDYYVVNQIGILSKLCVAIFVFLLGYGLTVQIEGNEGVIELSKFYLHRFKKLYLNYWFIWIIFVPISIFVFGRTFEIAFPEKTYVHVLLDIIGIHQWFYPSKPYSYNATWWFYSCIISLYLLFPFLYTMMKKSIAALLLLAIVLSFLPFSILSIKYYIVVFVLGMLIAKYNNIPSQGKSFIIWIVLLVLLCIERIYNKYPLMVDCFIIVALIYLYQSVKLPVRLLSVLEFIGKHSMNIFLFHTFIFSYWFKEFIYASRNPIMIFCLLLGICLIISVILEEIKKLTIYRL